MQLTKKESHTTSHVPIYIITACHEPGCAVCYGGTCSECQSGLYLNSNSQCAGKNIF